MGTPSAGVQSVTIVALLLAASLIGGCASDPPRDDAFYQGLGGKAGITEIVDAFLVRLAADEKLVDDFRRADIGRLRRLLIQQYCWLSGGPCEYTGSSMREAHRGMNVTPAEFDRLVRALRRAMDDVDVPPGPRNRLLAELAPLYADIVDG